MALERGKLSNVVQVAAGTTVGIITARSGVNITGGELTLVGTAFTVGQSGVVTATSFVGDGSGLSGVESWNQLDTWLYGGG